MKGIKRFAVIAIAIAAFVAVLALNVFALEPDSELTVIQEYPEAPQTGASLPESAGTEAAAAASSFFLRLFITAYSMIQTISPPKKTPNASRNTSGTSGARPSTNP